MGIRAFQNAASDNFRMARSQVIAIPDVDTYDCIMIPRFSVILDVVLWVKTAGSADTISVGFVGDGLSADNDHFLAATEAVATALGFKRGKYDFGTADFVNWDGRWCRTAGGIITLVNGTSAQTTGEFVVLAAYSVLH